MSKVIHPMITNETGQLINAALDEVLEALDPSDDEIYGFHISGSESEPYHRVSYLASAVGKRPAFMDFDNDTFDYGDWENAFFMPRPCMLKYDGTVDYYLDPDDYTKKEDGTTASDVANTSYSGNAMMEWGKDGKKIWMKIVPEGANSASVYIASRQVDSDYHAYSFVDSKGHSIDHFYTPIYQGSLISDKLRSISGQTNIASKTAQEEIDYAKANNTTTDVEWFTEVYSDILLINMLLILISKSTDTQSVFGLGNSNGYVSDSAQDYGKIQSGTMNTKGLFYGKAHSSVDDRTGVKVFGMENWWANQWRRYAGHINDNGTQKIKLTYDTTDGSTASGYNLDGSGYISVGSAPSGNGYISKMAFTEKSMNPSVNSGSSTTYYCDYNWVNNSQVDYALRGGACDGGFHCGAFCVYLNDLSSDAGWSRGAALSCKPLYKDE